MVRIKGLCQALGRVLGRALGREVSGDEEEAPLRQRLTPLAHRQWATVAVVEDIEHVDDVAGKAHEDSHDLVMEDVDANL